MRTWHDHRTTALGIALASCLAATGPAVALEPAKAMGDYVVKAWTEEQDLPHRLVYSVQQTRDRYIWLGTQGGLVRFDGLHFTVFGTSTSEAFVENSIRAVAETPDGTLWIAPLRSDLLRLRNGRFERLSGWLPEIWSRVGITDLLVSQKGLLWFGTGEGIGYLGAGDQPVILSPAVTHADLTFVRRRLVEDANGRIRAAAADGVRTIEDGRLSPLLGVGSTRAVLAARDGTLWLGIDGKGLQRYRDGTLTSVPLPSRLATADLRVTALREDRHANIWVATSGGLFRVRPEQGYAPAGLLPDAEVEDLLEDAEGLLWVATRSGLVQIKDPPFRSFAAGTGLQEVLTLVEDRNGAIWMATRQPPFLQIVAEGRTRPFTGPLPPGVQTVHVDRRGELLVGCDQGLVRLDGNRWVSVPGAPQVSVTTIAEDVRGELWIADGTGALHRLSSPYRRFGTGEGLPGKRIERVFGARDGSLWIATQDGVYQLKDGKITDVRLGEGQPWRYVRHVSEDADGTLWLGSRAGLTRIKNGQPFSFTAQIGLPDPIINAVVDDLKGNLWVGCSKGVFRVAKGDLERVAQGQSLAISAVLYGKRDGIAAGQAWGNTALRSRDGGLWFATTRGVTTIPHSRLVSSVQALPTFVESAVVNDKERIVSPNAVIEPGEGRLEFRFTALNFDAPDRVHFRYRLEPLETQWREVGRQRTATYTRVQPGAFTFRVSARGPDGTWREDGAAFSFTLQPHWYQTWWWYTVLVVLPLMLVAALAWLAHRLRVRTLKARERELAEKIDTRTRDLQQEVAEHERTEAKLHEQIAERERAEGEARLSAEKVTESNRELVSQRAALERENAERRRAEEDAGRERDLLHALMDNIPDLIYFKDLEGRYTRVNKAHAQALGLASPSEVVGREDADVHAPDFARASREEEREVLHAGRSVLGQVSHDARRDRWYLATKVPLRDSAGQITGLVGISKDITERRRAEQALEADLRSFLEVANSVARGDLTRRAKEGEDTLGRIAGAVNRMLEGFAAILAGARDTAFSVSSSASEILAAATEIAKGARYGSDEVQAASAAVEQMAASMNKVSRNAQESAEAARQVMEHLREGEESVSASTDGMARIDAAVSETADRMRLLERRSQQIFEIIALIEDLAAQSTLLSLNAAIEAAHAGEAGRGFGVVAEEIRRLAERSTQSTKEVTAIVEGMVEETRSVLAAMERGLREAHEGRQLSELAQKSLRTIQGLVERSAALSEQISRASREQAAATQHVSGTMQTIASVTDESAAGANESTRAVKELVDLADQLTHAISRFRVENGARSATAPRC